MLANWVSSCEVDGQVIFLDILANRYSRLGKSLGEAVIRGELDDTRPDFQEKIRTLGWLDKRPAVARSSSRSIIDAAREHSAEYDEGSAPKRLMASALRSLLSAKIFLALTSLDSVLSNLQSNNARAREATADPAKRTDVIAAFEIVERAAIGKDRCLQRSIALQHLLARNGFESSLVFGVRLNPFHAHCWLQDGDLVLNDTLEVVGPFQALRAVG